MKTFDLGQKVKFLRIDAQGAPVYGDGVVVAKLIGISKRVNYSVKVEGEVSADDPAMRGRDQAFNLEPEALDGNEEENAAYINHRQRIDGIVKGFETEQDAMVKATNEAIEAAHVEFFGAPMDV